MAINAFVALYLTLVVQKMRVASTRQGWGESSMMNHREFEETPNGITKLFGIVILIAVGMSVVALAMFVLWLTIAITFVAVTLMGGAVPLTILFFKKKSWFVRLLATAFTWPVLALPWSLVGLMALFGYGGQLWDGLKELYVQLRYGTVQGSAA